jgi:hypothetical protein
MGSTLWKLHVDERLNVKTLEYDDDLYSNINILLAQKINALRASIT